MSYTLDASAVLAMLLDEPGAELVTDSLRGSEISVVNLSEVYATLLDHGLGFDDAHAIVNPLPMRVRTFREAHAWEAARLRPLTKALGLSLGDRACLAQSLSNKLPVLTGDRRLAQASQIASVTIDLIR